MSASWLSCAWLHAGASCHRVSLDVWARYWKRLVASGRVSAADYPLSLCWKRYVHGGAERWLQMLVHVMYASIDGGLPAHAAQWYHDQVHAFLHDHVELDPHSSNPRGAFVLACVYCLPYQ